MNNDLLDMLADITPGAERAVVMYPTAGGEWACRWVGLDARQVANLLYQMADATVDQKIPPRKAWRPPTGGGRQG